MAKKTPAQIRDAKIAKLKKALEAKQITQAEYKEGVAKARAAVPGSAASKTAAAARKASTTARAKTVVQGTKTATGPAAQALKTASSLKAPLQTAGRFVRYASYFARIPKTPMQAAAQAALIASPYVAKKAGEMKRENDKKTVRVPASKGEKFVQSGARQATGRTPATTSRKPTGPRGRSEDAGSPSRTPKPLTPAQKAAAARTTVSGNVHTVKRGDSLWQIAKSNNTTVSALLKANPTIAKRKEAGKTTIFAGSKVRIPKGNK